MFLYNTYISFFLRLCSDLGNVCFVKAEIQFLPEKLLIDLPFDAEMIAISMG
jgi:hypothetical protein